MPPHFDQILEKLNGSIQSYCPKSVIFGYFAHFEAIFVHFVNLSEVTTSCKISDNFNGWPWRKIRTNGRTGLETIDPLR